MTLPSGISSHSLVKTLVGIDTAGWLSAIWKLDKEPFDGLLELDEESLVGLLHVGR